MFSTCAFSQLLTEHNDSEKRYWRLADAILELQAQAVQLAESGLLGRCVSSRRETDDLARSPSSQRAKDGSNQVWGYVLVQGILQWPNLNTTAETFADVSIYKAMSLLRVAWDFLVSPQSSKSSVLM